MRRHLTISILTIGLSLPGLADEYDSSRDVYSLRLADLMIETQFRYFKLWYAGRQKIGNLLISSWNRSEKVSTMPLEYFQLLLWRVNI
jgi:hypothetical protein